MADINSPNQLGAVVYLTNPLQTDLDANGYKVIDLAAPTAATDGANKAYVDAQISGGGAALWSQFPATQTVAMANNSIVNANNISANGDVTAGLASLTSTAAQSATNATQITNLQSTKANLASPTFTGRVTVPTPANPTDAATKAYVDATAAGGNILPLNNTFTGTNAFNGSDFTVGTAATPISDTFEIHAQDVNLRAHGTTDVLNITSFAGTVIAAGGAVNITGGASSSMYAAVGTVGIGGPVNHIIVDGNDIEDVANLTASATVSAATFSGTTVTATGNVSGNNVSATTAVSAPTVSATTVTATGNIVGNNVAATATVSAAGVNCSGSVQCATLGATGNITTNAGTIRTLGGSIFAEGTGPGQGVVEGAVKVVAPLGDFNTVFTGEVQLGDNAGVNELTFISNEPTSHVITAIEEGGTGTPGGVLDTRINPISADLTGSTLNIKAKNGAGATTTMASVNLSGLTPDPLFSQFLSLISPAGTSYNLTAGQMNSAIDFEVSTTGSLTVNLPNGVPAGSAVFIKLNGETSAVGTNIFLTPPGVAVGAPPSVNIRPAGGCFAVAMNTVGGDTQYAISESFAYYQALNDYLPLAGGTMTGTLAVQDTTNIEAKNITTALLTPLPSVGYISALGPMQVENGNFLVANGTSSEIGLAATASPPVGQVATISYNYAADDLLHVNKSIEAPGAVLGGNDVVPLLTFKDSAVFNVSKSGSDVNGTGSANAPYLTIGAAVAAALATGNEAIVNIGPGVFTESLTISSTSGIMLQGCIQSDRNIEGTTIKGTITVNCTGADNLNNNQIVLSGLAIVPGRIVDTSTAQHTLIIESCRIEGEADTGGVCVNVNMTATDGRTFINNCTMTQEALSTGTSAMVSVNVGWLNIQNTNISLRAEGNAIHMSGSSLLVRMSNCTLESGSASSTPNPLLFLNTTSASPHNIALTSFTIPSATSKTTAAILATRPSLGLITAIVANCIFGINGTLSTGNVIQFGPATALALLVAANRSLNSAAGAYASAIQSGATVLPLSLVGETAVSTVNNLSGALTLAAGTNVTLGTVGNTITINASGGSGGITQVAAGSGISVANPTGPTATITNTGLLTASAGSGISIAGSGAGNLDIANTGILGITAADSSVSVSSGQNPTVGLPSQTLTPAAYTWPSVTVNQNGVITAISENSVPFTSISAGNGISVSGSPGSATIANTGVLSLQPGAGIQLSANTGDVTISAIGSAGGAVLYLNPSVASDIPTYYSMSSSLLSAPEQTLIASSSGGTPALVAAFATPSGFPNATQIDGGVWNYTAYASVDSLSGSSTLYAEIYKRSSLGVETLLSTSDTSISIASLTPTPVALYFNDVFQPATVLASDRIVVKIYFTHSGGSATTCTLYSEGATHYSYIQTTINAVVGNQVQSVSGGTGISISGTLQAPVVNNDGVLSVSVNSTLVNSGTAQDPILGINTTGTITTQVVDTTRIAASGTGSDYSTFGTYPRVSGSYVPPTDPAQLAPVQYVNDNKGVQSLAASGSSITVGGTAADATVAVANSGVTAGSYTNASITVLADGRVSAASSGTAGVTSVSGTAGQVASTGGTTPVISLVNTTVTPGSYTNASLTVGADGRLTAASSGTAGVTSVSGTLGQIASTGGTTPVLSLANSGVVANTYAYPSSVTFDSLGRATACTAGANPATQFLALAGGTMGGAINMGAQAITNAGSITTTGVIAGALSLPNAGAGSGTAGITALQTDTNAAPTNNLFITQTSGALSLFKPIANPVILYSAGASTNIFTYLVPQFYGERHVYTGSALSPVLNYNTNSTYTVGGNSIALNPFYVELTNGSANTLTVKVRFPGALAVYPPVSTLPTTIPPSGTWTDQTILPVGLVGTTTPTIASGATKRLFWNGTNWYLI